jgi:alkylated DNA repair dioxygenase AlkB
LKAVGLPVVKTFLFPFKILKPSIGNGTFLLTLQLMLTLFPTAPIYPDGFVYQPDFISHEEETNLLQQVEKLPLKTFIFQGYEARRKVASFGYDWSFEKRTLSKGKEIPALFDWLIEKVAAHLQLERKAISEFLVTQYPEGAVINWHRDAPPFDAIIGISLLSDCVFKLRPHDKAKQERNNTLSIPVKRRSLYVLKDEARTAWEHSIAPVKQTRYSITLRTLKAT